MLKNENVTGSPVLLFAPFSNPAGNISVISVAEE